MSHLDDEDRDDLLAFCYKAIWYCADGHSNYMLPTRTTLEIRDRCKHCDLMFPQADVFARLLGLSLASEWDSDTP